MAHPYAAKAKTGQELADARYSFPASNSTPDSALIGAATQTDRGEKAADNYAAAPARQISETGKVK